MTQRSILAGETPTVIIKAGGSITVRGQEGDRVVAETSNAWGLQVEKAQGDGREIARARAKAGEHVLFDVRVKLPNLGPQQPPQDFIQVQMGGGGEVLVP